MKYILKPVIKTVLGYCYTCGKKVCGQVCNYNCTVVCGIDCPVYN